MASRGHGYAKRFAKEQGTPVSPRFVAASPGGGKPVMTPSSLVRSAPLMCAREFK